MLLSVFSIGVLFLTSVAASLTVLLTLKRWMYWLKDQAVPDDFWNYDSKIKMFPFRTFDYKLEAIAVLWAMSSATLVVWPLLIPTLLIVAASYGIRAFLRLRRAIKRVREVAHFHPRDCDSSNLHSDDQEGPGERIG